MHLAGKRNGIDYPDPLHAEAQILPNFLQGFHHGVFRRENFDAQIRRALSQSRANCLSGFSVTTQTSGTRKRSEQVFTRCSGTTKKPRGRQSAHNSQIKKACKVECSQVGVGRSTILPSTKLRIMLEARVKVLFGADDFGDGHDAMIPTQTGMRNSMK